MFTLQGHLAFRSPYHGAGSLGPAANARNTHSADFVASLILWHGSEFVVDAMVKRRFGLFNSTDIAAYPKYEVSRFGNTGPTTLMPRNRLATVRASCLTLVVVERVGTAGKHPGEILGGADGLLVGLHRALPQGHAQTLKAQPLLKIAVRKVDAPPKIEVVSIGQAAEAVMTRAAPQSVGQVMRHRVLPHTAW